MVFTHTLFRRRLVSKEVTEAAKALVKTYGGSGRPEKVGKIFAPIHHNYSYGIKKTTLVARLIHQVKVKKIPLQKVFDATPWLTPKNGADALALSKMGISKDEWAVRFAELVMLDNAAVFDRLNKGMMWAVPLDLALFFYVFGADWKRFLWTLGAGVGIAEASDFIKWNSGSSLVSFTFYAVILQRLIASRKLMTLPGAVLAWFLIGPLVMDPPKNGVTGAKNATAHDLHYGTLGLAYLLRSFRII